MRRKQSRRQNGEANEKKAAEKKVEAEPEVIEMNPLLHCKHSVTI